MEGKPRERWKKEQRGVNKTREENEADKVENTHTHTQPSGPNPVKQ